MIYKQSEIAKSKEWDRSKIKKIRDSLLNEGEHWWKEGTVIFWNQEALDIVEGRKDPVVNDTETYPELDDTAIEAFVILQQKNPTWVRGRVDGAGVDILIPKRLTSKLVGKTIRIQKAEDDGFTTYYRYIA